MWQSWCQQWVGKAPMVVAAALGLVACAPMPPAPGSTTPTARYALTDGGTRLEYATGPYGRTTWMVDTDATGRVTQSHQVLNELDFLELQSQRGLEQQGVLRLIGTPGERKAIGWMGGSVWSWRYPTNDCLWFQVSFSREGQVTGSGYGIDPRCDAPSDGFN